MPGPRSGAKIADKKSKKSARPKRKGFSVRERALLLLFTLSPFGYIAFEVFYGNGTSSELAREWTVIEETGRRVRTLEHKDLHSKRAVSESWKKTEDQVRADFSPESEGESSEAQGLWIEW